METFAEKEKQKQEWLVESLLFDLSNDIGEANNLASDRPGLVQKLNNRMTLLDSEIAKMQGFHGPHHEIRLKFTFRMETAF